MKRPKKQLDLDNYWTRAPFRFVVEGRLLNGIETEKIHEGHGAGVKTHEACNWLSEPHRGALQTQF
jgi:hypothetical protein